MPQFILALLALVGSFSQNGKPASLPPATQAEVSQRGSQVSNLARNLNLLQNSTNGTGDETGNTTNNSADNFGSLVSGQTPDLPRLNGRTFGMWVSSQANSQNQTQNQTQNETGNQSTNSSTNPDTSRVSANNINSGFQMPTNLPQVALGHSRALEPVDPSATPFPLPPGRRR